MRLGAEGHDSRFGFAKIFAEVEGFKLIQAFLGEVLPCILRTMDHGMLSLYSVGTVLGRISLSLSKCSSFHK